MPTDQRPAPPRLHAGVDPRLLRAHRRREEGKRHRHRAARAQRARGSEPPRAARDGRAAPAEGGDHQLPRGPDRGGRRRQQPGGRRRPAPARCRSRASSTSSATTSWRTRRRSSSASRRASEVRLRCAYFITCTEVVKDAGGEIVELRCTYDPATRGGDAPDGRTVQGDAALGVGARTRCRPRCGSTTGCSRSRIPRTRREGKTFLDYLNPHSLEVLDDAKAEPRLAGAAVGDALPVRAARLLLRRPRLAARRARLQPHRLAARHLGEDRARAGP